MNKVNMLTVDVEDYFQVENFKKVIDFSDWGKYEIRVAKNTEKILGLLERANVKATFFVLGWVAEKSPGLVKRIHKAGHEVASHGYAHQLIYTQRPEEFREDLRTAGKILENIIQEPVLGYRAPSYSITKKSTWALDILMEEGLKYDSSLFPIHHDKGGLPEAKRYPYKIYNHTGYIWEFPISTIRLLNQNIPFSGGGYFRLLPYNLVKLGIKRINKEGFPAITYIHPWELDPEQPRIKAGYLSNFRHYLNISKTEAKLRQMLADFEFKPIRDYLTLEKGK